MREWLSPYDALVCRLAGIRPVYEPACKYYWNVLATASILSELRRRTVSGADLAYRLGVVSDHCLGLPADGELVAFFCGVFGGCSDVWVRLNVAQCVGYLWGGIDHARPMFITLLRESDSSVQGEAAETLSRVLCGQRRLIEGYRDRIGASEEDCLRNIGQIEATKQELSEFAQSANMQSILEKAGCISGEDILVCEQRRDERFLLGCGKAILRDHAGEFVVIRNGAVLGFAKTTADVEGLLRGTVPDGARVLVERITPEAFEEEAPVRVFMG